MSDNHPELIKQFRDVTGADEHRAQFFLESSAWELDLALYSFFENDGSNAPPAPAPAPVVLTDSDPELLEDDDEDLPPPPVRVQKKDKPKKKEKTSYATLASLQQSSSSDEEEGQAFYAGGSERSGQQILGPGKNKDSIVANMFKSVKEHGATMMNPHSEASGSSAFSGTGYKLGQTPDDTVVVEDMKKPERKKKPSPDQVVILRLWRNGFSLDGGELRNYSDPANAEFLEHVRRGEIPAELRRGPEVYLTMEDRRHEEFSKQPAGPAQPFQGKGHLLGSPAPTTIGSTAPNVINASDKEANEKTAQSNVNLNEEEPITNIQFRLADGSRLVGRFNHTHTVANLREYILTAAPVYQLQNFILQTTFPNKELTDQAQSIKDANLLNALVVQRLK